jgi:hypothetical protein
MEDLLGFAPERAYLQRKWWRRADVDPAQSMTASGENEPMITSDASHVHDGDGGLVKRLVTRL